MRVSCQDGLHVQLSQNQLFPKQLTCATRTTQGLQQPRAKQAAACLLGAGTPRLVWYAEQVGVRTCTSFGADVQ